MFLINDGISQDKNKSIEIFNKNTKKRDIKNRSVFFKSLHDSALYFPKIEKLIDSMKINSGPKAIINEIVLKNDSLSNKDTLRFFKNKLLTPSALQQIQVHVFQILEEGSYLNSRINDLSYNVLQVETDSLLINVIIDIDYGEKVKISNVSFWGNKHISSEYLRRVIQVKTPFWYSPKIIKNYLKALKKIDYLEVSDETFINKRDSIYEIIFKVKEGNLINFDFIVGYQPATSNKTPKDESNWSGHVLFNFKNLFGGGRKLFIEWDKPKTVSEELNLNYREPYIFSLPFHMEAGYRRLIEDSLFNSSEKRIKGVFPWNDFQLNFEYLVKNATNDSLMTNEDQPLRVKSQLTGIELNYDSRENKINPYKGFNANIRLFTGNYDDDGSDSSFTKTRMAKLEVSASFIFPVNKPFCLFIKGQEKFVNSSRFKVPLSEQYFIGGSNTIRGYRERQFLSEFFHGGSLEGRFLFSKNSRFHFFIDNGVIKGAENNKSEWLTSYGVGFLIPVKLGLMEFDYGIPKGANFNQGILHFRLINEF